MTCPACGRVVEPSAKFCSECGSPLTANPITANRLSYTPPHLAEKILASRSALLGERKQVTVLFADIKGSLDLAGQVDAEAWHGILDRFFAILADGIHRVEGTINQYTGDGIMALFGAPIAHEDHAQRACHAALALRSELRRYADVLRVSHGLNFSVRMGINSGEVIVGRIGDDLRMDYTAQGQTVGLAARMEQLAQPGTVLLTAHTAQLVAGYFSVRDLGPAQVKGAGEAFHVFELEGPGALHSRLDQSRRRGFARFIGRGAEMSALEAALASAVAGAGQIVGVEGEAGVGKSRLCAEIASRCRDQNFRVYETQCPSYGRHVPFLPIQSLLRAYFGIAEHDPPAGAREKIAGRLLVRDDSARELLPLLHEFLAIGDPAQPVPRMDPEARQRRLFAFVRDLVAAPRGDEVVLILIDDLHWIDAASDAFLAELVDAVPNTRSLVLLNYRPEYRAAWMTRPEFHALRIAPLAPPAAAALLSELLGDDAALAPLRDLIHERTAGNPFFIEEVVQSLMGDGTLEPTSAGLVARHPITEIRIPVTVQAVLAARIDRLAEEDKMVLQTAAVIGKTFGAAVLSQVLIHFNLPLAPFNEGLRVSAALQRLVDAGLIIEQDANNFFAFKHPLTQEVAYGSQLKTQREKIHAVVAEVLRDLGGDRQDEIAALLAHHWERAGEELAAARCHRRAAEWSGINDIVESMRHSHRVRELAAGLPDSAEVHRLKQWAILKLLDLGWRSGMAPAEAKMLFDEGRELAARVGRQDLLASYLNTYGIVVGMSGDVDGGLAIVREGWQLAQRSNDAGLRLVTAVALVQAQTTAGDLRSAEKVLAESLVAEPDDLGVGAVGGSFSPYLYLLMMRGHVYTEMGRLATARADLGRVITLGQQRREIELIGWAHEFVVYLDLAIGHSDEALEHAKHSVESAARIGSPLSRASADYSLAAAQLARGDGRAAAAAAERGLALIRARNTGRHWESRGLALLAHAMAQAGERARALALAEEAEVASRRGGERVFECLACLAIARARRLADPVGARALIEATLARVETIATVAGAGLYLPLVQEERAWLARALGQGDAGAVR